MKSAARNAVAISAVALVVLGATALPAAAADPKVAWNFAMFGPPKRPYTASIEDLAKQVSDRTKGEFTITIHYNEILAPAKEMIDGLKIGAFEAGAWLGYYAPGKNPALTGLDLPFLPFPTLESVRRTFDVYMAHPVLVAEMARWDTRYFFAPGTPPNEATGKGKPPTQLSDWKGQRVRAAGVLGTAMKALGAVPTSMPVPEVYGALERGLLDSVATTLAGFAPYRLYEVCNWYTTNLSGGTPSAVHLVSAKAWHSLPEAYRQAIADSRSAADKAQDIANDEGAKKTIQLYQERGRIAITYTPEQLAEIQRIAGQLVWDAWVAEMKDKGIPGKELLDLLIATSHRYAEMYKS